MSKTVTCICGSQDLNLKFEHTRPAPGDKIFFEIDDNYKHDIYECTYCGHFVAVNSFDDTVLYDGQYVEISYGDKLKSTYEKIINLPPEQSDNVARVQNILRYMDKFYSDNVSKSVMDVGSGLCVFLHEVRKHRPDWVLKAVDPDPVQSAHARDVVGVDCIQSDFMFLEGQDNQYDLITFNKVLEHVPDPVGMLAKARNYLNDTGLVYVELPDGTQAALHGKDRQEFYVEHLWAFSLPSITILAERAGFTPLSVERIRDPSGKYSLRAFMKVGGM